MTRRAHPSARRTLLVLRHARAASAPGLADVERPLAGRGEEEATAAGRWLRATGLVTDVVVCSTARRTRQTWGLVAMELDDRPPVHYDARVYRNTVDDLLDVVRETCEGAGTLVLVAHNPAAGQLIAALTGAVAPEFPTCGLALVEFEPSWADVAPGTGTVVRTWAPPR